MVLQTNPPKEARMSITRIRTTAIILVATFSFAGASVFPTISQAAKNNGGYQKTVGKVKKWQNTCPNAQISFENAVTLAEISASENDQKGFEEAIGLAQAIHTNATASGCSIS
jgi:hypothetical protein